MSQQFAVAIYALTTGLALDLLARSGRVAWAGVLLPIVLITSVFSIGRIDLLIHRAGSYVERIESQANSGPDVKQPGWEEYKRRMPATRLVPIYDLLSATVFFFLFIDGQMLARKAIPPRWSTVYVSITCVLFLIGCASIPIAIVFARST